jgi:serine protease Do
MPSNTVRDVYNQLTGPEHKVARGSIGVEFTAQQNPALSRMYGVKSGVTISNIRPPGGPADKAGLQTGDTITAVNGKPVKNGEDLISLIAATKPGTKVDLTFVRNGQEKTAKVTVADRNKLFGNQNDETAESNDEGQPSPSKLGITVRSVTPEMAQRLGTPEGKGVQVTDVKVDSFGEDIDVHPGDVILQVNKQPVNSEEEFRKLTQDLKSGQDVVFLIHRGRGSNGGNVFVSGTLP